MSNVPPTFAQIHKIAGFTETDIEKRWGDVFEKTAQDVLGWLASDPLLSDIQKNRLNERLNKILLEGKQTSFFIELDPVLEENQRTVVAKKYAEVFKTKLAESIKEATDKCTPEQKQVLEAYTQTQKT